LVTERTDGQVRWRLMEGFRNILALTFSPTEIMALAFSRHLLTPLAGTEIQSTLESAINKAAARIPPSAMGFLHQLQTMFSGG
jgi:predicted DNA-binding transcriptional regulator YafY